MNLDFKSLAYIASAVNALCGPLIRGLVLRNSPTFDEMYDMIINNRNSAYGHSNKDIVLNMLDTSHFS